MEKKRKPRKKEGDSPLESLRIERTQLTQDEFIAQCGFARATYQRWASGATPLKPTPEQMVAVCRLCKITLDELFERLGIDLAGVPS
jgi:transcriptional regulator with XRE-family HTH domain